MHTYLNPKIYYSDLYDEHTIDNCRRIEKGFKERKYIGKEAVMAEGAKKLMIYWETGERYIKKESRIAEWMDSDQKKDDKLRDTPIPSHMPCLYCSKEMNFDGHKHLHAREDGIERVLFFYECERCNKRRAFWEDGKEFEAKKDYCKKCGGVQEVEFKDTEKEMVSIHICSKCKDKVKSITKKYISETSRSDPEYQNDKERFCLSDEDGMKYVKYKQDMAFVGKMMEEYEEKEKNKDIYDAVAKLQKLKVSELQDLLDKKLKKENYTKLEFIKTEIEKDVVVSFTVQDEKNGREEYNSRKQLEKITAKILSDTNWRLMTDGVNYRLGILTGRLRGYEREEDLIKLVKKL